MRHNDEKYELYARIVQMSWINFLDIRNTNIVSAHIFKFMLVNNKVYPFK